MEGHFSQEGTTHMKVGSVAHGGLVALSVGIEIIRTVCALDCMLAMEGWQ